MVANVSDDLSPGALTTLVTQAQGGDAGTTDRLFTTLYQQLRRMARREAGRLGPNAPLGPTTLLHEAWLEMSKRGGGLVITCFDTEPAEQCAQPERLVDLMARPAVRWPGLAASGRALR